MIERIILFKLNEPSERDELAAESLAFLSKLPDIDELSVGVPADPACEKSWDLSVVIGFANAALLTKVLESTQFDAFVSGVLKDRVAVMADRPDRRRLPTFSSVACGHRVRVRSARLWTRMAG